MILAAQFYQPVADVILGMGQGMHSYSQLQRAAG
jgi:hypothetical protein